MIRFLTAGESHGEKLTGIIEGLPANLLIDEDYINRDLKRRQAGYGRSERMKIESDRIIITSGLMKGRTTGNPLAFELVNRGRNIPLDQVYAPRPGHGDLVGMVKYGQEGGRSVLERASARETASRVVLGSISKLFLRELGIQVHSHVKSIGRMESSLSYYEGLEEEDLLASYDSELRMADRQQEEEIKSYIDRAGQAGDSLGGDIEIIARGLPIGLGSYVNWDRKLDAKLAYALMSIQAIKSVEVGRGKESSRIEGANFHDEIFYDGSYYRKKNYSGGIEAGISNGEDLVLTASMKPIPTLRSGLKTVDVRTKKARETNYERSDVCAVPAASLVCENVVAAVLANEVLEMLGGDFMEEIIKRYEDYLDYVGRR